ncbi:MAG: anti-sigma factor family protein [Afipia sp.]
MAAMTGGNDDLLLQAYCDGELDPAAALAFEQRMAADAKLRAQYDRLMALRGTLRSLPLDDEPPYLQARIDKTLDGERSLQGNWSWQALAAAAVFGAILTSTVMLTMDRYDARQQTVQQIVANHIRSLLAPQPFDVASSDRHTVKPWFTTRIPESPQVVDLGSQGFPLAGGRVDVIGREPVATIVYRHAAHMVSLTTLRPGQSIPAGTIAGYNVRSWSDGDFTYVAVSDLPAEEIESFERAFRAGLSH